MGRLPAGVKAIADSGIFNDETLAPGNEHYFRQTMIAMTDLVNEEVPLPNEACMTAYPKKQDRYKCIMVDYLYPFVKVDLFIMQSLYDSYVGPYILGLHCVLTGIDSCKPNELATLQAHHDATVKLIKVIVGRNPRSGAFAISCSHHDMSVGTYNSASYKVGGLTVQQAVQRWQQGQPAVYLDEAQWPGNEGCAHLRLS